MPSFAHKNIVAYIERLDNPPDDDEAFGEWIKAGKHLDFLRSNAFDEELVVYGSGEYSFIHSVLVPNDALDPLDKGDLLQWGCNPFTSIASYCYGGGRDGMWIERGISCSGSKTIDAGMDLVFGRAFEGWPDSERDYFEVHQEYTHTAEIHWCPEQKAYCRYDPNGDIEHVVSVTKRGSRDDKVSLVSFTWETLEDYLAVSNMSLVRMFDFTLLRRSLFSDWPEGEEDVIEDSDTFFYRQKVCGTQCAYTRGVQIIGPRRPVPEIISDIKEGWAGRRHKRYVEFIARDWRNKCITKISTHPHATTNYFSAHENNLPFELSPAFFRPEVLSKYKTDREKYTVGERDITCRASWRLKGYDVNEAGQVHAYICDLRELPYEEQLHWQSYNEESKAGIAERAYRNDFLNQWMETEYPLPKILSIMRRWNDKGVPWWKLRDEALLERVSKPLTSSRDEWANAFMDLSQLVVEGLQTKYIRAKLKEVSIEYADDDQSIALLEKLVNGSRKSGEDAQLEGMRTVQKVRSKVKGHAGSSEGKQLAQDAIQNHESFGGHFEHVCGIVAAELESIERLM